MYEDRSFAAPATGLPGEGTTAARLPWIRTVSGLPYFVTEDGDPWTPIGQNDSIEWVELKGLFRRRDLAGVEDHLRWLRSHGVNTLRLMLECAYKKHRYIERPTGRFVPAMVQLWDDLFAMCERVGMRILLTPVDTFWTWIKFSQHPWAAANGGPLKDMREALLCADTRRVIKDRLEFAVRRWGGSGALFAWDLWNEIHPATAGDSAEPLPEFMADLSRFVRNLETELYGRAHPQTVSIYGPELRWRAHQDLRTPIFRHPDLDFASIHIYREGSIDYPRDTVAPAVAMGKLVAECLAEIRDDRPFLDTEHGPIHYFKDKRRTLPAFFDDEYFRHMSWAHLASGAVGGGMRWPNRKPHVLTPGMRSAQRAMADFLPLIDWTTFGRRNVSKALHPPKGVHAFGCASNTQALVYLLRGDSLRKINTRARAILDPAAPPREASARVPGLAPGRYRVTGWSTLEGRTVSEAEVAHEGSELVLTVPDLVTDRALAVTRL